MVSGQRNRPEPVEAAVRTALAALAVSDATSTSAAQRNSAPVHVAVGLSGGRDSIVLLHAMAGLRAAVRPAASITAGAAPAIRLSAVHVHHGLSAQADRWATFCAAQCAQRNVPLTIEHVTIVRRGGMSLEAAARDARYRALLGGGADVVALAHHADDQAETLLLQLLRGAGPHGAAGMPGRQNACGKPIVLRPLLAVPAAALAAYASAQRLIWIEDESNADTRLRRNALRHRVVPALREAFPGYPATLVRAAALQAEAASLLDELAARDAVTIVIEDTAWGPALDRARFAALAAESGPRARNLMRWFLRRHGLPAPSSARLHSMIAQCVHARTDARLCVRHAGAEVAVFRGRIVVHASLPRAAFAVPWTGAPTLALPGGTISFHDTTGRGLAAARIASQPVVARSRGGGERLQLGADRPRQAIATLLQARGVPLWERDGWPLLWCGDVLAAVPGLGVDVAFAARPGERAYTLDWHRARIGNPCSSVDNDAGARA